jgi:hypothetical protein
VRLGQAVRRQHLEVTVPEPGGDRAGALSRFDRAGVVARVPQASAHVGDDMAQSPVVVQLAGDGLGLGQQFEDPAMLPERGGR